MSVTVQELRYPFSNFIEFGGFLGSPSSAGIIIGFFGIISILYLSLVRRSSAEIKFAAASVALAPFNNPAYSFVGISPPDICAFAALLLFIRSFFLSYRHISTPFAIDQTLVLRVIPYVSLLLGSLLGFLSPRSLSLSNGTGSDLFTFLTANLRLLSSVAVGIILSRSIRGSQSFYLIPFFHALLRISVCCILSVQLVGYVLFLAGIPLYGTFQGAGFIDFPAFGAVSIERGHLGRIICFFPFLLLTLYHQSRSSSLPSSPSQSAISSHSSYLNHGYKWVWLSIFSVILTFSTSAYAMLFVFLFSNALFRLPSSLLLISRLRLRRAWLALAAFILIASLQFQSILMPIFAKAFDMVFSGSAEVRGLQPLTFSLLGRGFWGSQGRLDIGVDSFDLGYSVSTQYFGVFYLIFIALLAVIGLVYPLRRTGANDLSSLRVSGVALVLFFNIFEVSLGQYTAVASWFVLP